MGFLNTKFLSRHIQLMKFLRATKVIMNCDLKGEFERLAFILGSYLCLAFDDEEFLMHFSEEKIL